MTYEQDWMMRQVKSMVSFIIYLLTGKKSSSDFLQNFLQTTSESKNLYTTLKKFIAQGKICEAENKLYEAITLDDETLFYTAILFYAEINQLSEEELEKNNFPREEILSGLQDICRIYNFPLDTLDGNTNIVS